MCLCIDDTDGQLTMCLCNDDTNHVSGLQEAVKIDGDVLFGLLKKVCPATYKHLVSAHVTVYSIIS